LAERPEDVPDLVRHFLARFSAEEGKRIRTVSPQALQLLCAYSWPGNVRQLENAVFRAVVLADGDEIGTGEFPQIAAQVTRHQQAAAESATGPSFPVAEPSLPPRESPPLAAEHWASTLETQGASLPGLSLLDGNGDVRPLEDLENEILRFAITRYRGQMSQVARKLRIGRSTLYRKLKDLGLDTPPEAADSENVASG
jgi:DNA-binding NtrC family response regulator